MIWEGRIQIAPSLPPKIALAPVRSRILVRRRRAKRLRAFTPRGVGRAHRRLPARHAGQRRGCSRRGVRGVRPARPTARGDSPAGDHPLRAAGGRLAAPDRVPGRLPGRGHPDRDAGAGVVPQGRRTCGSLSFSTWTGAIAAGWQPRRRTRRCSRRRGMIRFWEFIAQCAPPLLSWVVRRRRVSMSRTKGVGKSLMEGSKTPDPFGSRPLVLDPFGSPYMVLLRDLLRASRCRPRSVVRSATEAYQGVQGR